MPPSELIVVGCGQYAQQGEAAKMADVCLFVFACYLRLHWESGGNCSGRQQDFVSVSPLTGEIYLLEAGRGGGGWARNLFISKVTAAMTPTRKGGYVLVGVGVRGAINMN
jgi:hypothetical protein